MKLKNVIVYGILGKKLYDLYREQSCPPAILNDQLNKKNQMIAVNSYSYSYTNTQKQCEHCVAFDVSPRILSCMSVEDRKKYGYCWMHHFKAEQQKTCSTWVGNQPITTNKDSYDWQKRYT